MLMNVVFFGDMACRIGRALPPDAAAVTEVHFIDRTAAASDQAAVLARAEVLVSMVYDARLAAATARLRLLQVPGIGLDHVDAALLPAGAALAVCRGHEDAVVEYVLAEAIAWRRGLTRLAGEFRAGDWSGSSRTGGPTTRELSGTPALVIGAGAMGRRLAQALKWFGVEVVCCTRHPESVPQDVRAIAYDGLGEALANAELVVLACALDERTRALLGASQLAQMRGDALLVNVARAECIDEQALFEACRDRRIAGAVLDVWYAYPGADQAATRPSKFPFDSLGNVVMTPHISAWTNGVIERRARAIGNNLLALHRGDTLHDTVRPGPRRAP
jgi:phosphoglycerate dehydrogenase-like enzyme